MSFQREPKISVETYWRRGLGGGEGNLRIVLNLLIYPFLFMPHVCTAFLKYALLRHSQL